MTPKTRSEWPTPVYEIGVFVHDGQEYRSGGSFVSPTHLIGYVTQDNFLRSWDSTKILGRYQERSRRPAVFFGHRSHWSTTYHYGRVTTPDGAVYSGSGFGVGVLWRGKRMKANAKR